MCDIILKCSRHSSFVNIQGSLLAPVHKRIDVIHVQSFSTVNCWYVLDNGCLWALPSRGVSKAQLRAGESVFALVRLLNFPSCASTVLTDVSAILSQGVLSPPNNHIDVPLVQQQDCTTDDAHESQGQRCTWANSETKQKTNHNDYATGDFLEVV